MYILKQIFINSFIYKFIKSILNMYCNSNLKKVFSWIWNICVNSFIGKKIKDYVNSTPRYKHSFLLQVNKFFYDFVVKYSARLYNFVEKTYKNSYFVNEYEKIIISSKNCKIKNTSLFIGIFFTSYTVISCFLERSIVGNIYLIILSVLLWVVYFLSNFIVSCYYNSLSYKFVCYLLKWEVVDND